MRCLHRPTAKGPDQHGFVRIDRAAALPVALAAPSDNVTTAREWVPAARCVGQRVAHTTKPCSRANCSPPESHQACSSPLAPVFPPRSSPPVTLPGLQPARYRKPVARRAEAAARGLALLWDKPRRSTVRAKFGSGIVCAIWT